MGRKRRFEQTAGECVPTPRVRGVAELQSIVGRHLKRISEIEKDICRLQAEQVREGAAYVRDQLELDERLGMTAAPGQDATMVAEIAVARGVSTLSASSWLSDAFVLDDTLPFTLEALERGEISLGSARTIAIEVNLIEDLALRRFADEVVAMESAGQLPGKIKKLAQTRVIDIDPEAGLARAERARADRHLSLYPGEPGVGVLTANLPAEQATACWNALHEHAVGVKAVGNEERSLNQIMCDEFVGRITGVSKPGKVKVRLDLVMSEVSLLGLSDAPAQLLPLGPIPAQIARRLVALGDTWLRRIFTDPVDGSALLSDPKRRHYRGALRDLVLARDRTCRGPACPSPIRDIDHVVEHAHGGPTTFGNGEGVSKGCHTMRDRPDVTVATHGDSNAVTWTLPSGARATSLPPPALGFGSGDLYQILNRRRITTASDEPVPRRPLRRQLRC
jgi:hypothetical protein